MTSLSNISYRLVENTICSKINFCFPDGPDGASCLQRANAVLRPIGLGKVGVISLGVPTPTDRNGTRLEMIIDRYMVVHLYSACLHCNVVYHAGN